MTITRFLVFVLPFLAILGIASMTIVRVGITAGVIPTQGWTKIAVIIIFTAMPIVLFGSMTLASRVWHPVLQYPYIAGGLWLGLLAYLFIAAVITAICYLVSVYVYPLPVYAIGSMLAIISFVLVLYGAINTNYPRVTTMEVNSPSLAPFWKDKTIVLVADTHLGTVRRERFLKKVVVLINKQNPDLVLIAGDVVDGPVFPHQRGVAPFGDISATHGVVYVPGNHEYYSRDWHNIAPLMEKHTTMLKDKTLEVNGTTIIGVDYRSESLEATKNRVDRLSIPSNKPSIAILHDPKNSQALYDKNVSLVVSGHTHCGQFFPISLLVRAIYKEKTYGVSYHGEQKAAQVTTCGVGTSIAPIRIGADPEIVVIKVKE